MTLMRYNGMKKYWQRFQERNGAKSSVTRTRGGMFSSLGLRSIGQIIQLHHEISCCVSVCVLSKCLSDKDEEKMNRNKKNTQILCVGGVYSTCGALEAWCWNAVSHETGGRHHGPG